MWSDRRVLLRTEPVVKEKPDEFDSERRRGRRQSKDAARMIDPIEQFNIEKIFTIGHIGNQEIAFTNSSAYMLVSVALISLLMMGTGRRLVPSRLQSVSEISYEFVANTIRSSAGSEGMKFFPLVFSIFMFVCVSNMIGIIPYAFTVSSHIIITAALALLVFFTVLIYGFFKNGLKFFKLFVPSGIPIVILPLVVLIEIISFLSRPISHSVRLFANMLAGHITLKVFASFVTMLGAMGIAGWAGAVLPLGLTVALTALELLVAFLQAYVFTILTCIYLNDAIHPGH
jgi:F-type H+-transporting ATPase subunit a